MRSNKDIKKRMVLRKTLKQMESQINKLEAKKSAYIKSAQDAKQKNLMTQYNLALSGLKMTIIQQKRIWAMKLNFEITSQMKDVTEMTSEFAKAMGILSKDMSKLSKDKSLMKIGQQFEEAMMNVEIQTEQLEDFMSETESKLDTLNFTDPKNETELKKMIDDGLDDAVVSESEIDNEIKKIKSQVGL